MVIRSGFLSHDENLEKPGEKLWNYELLQKRATECNEIQHKAERRHCLCNKAHMCAFCKTYTDDELEQLDRAKGGDGNFGLKIVSEED